MRVLVATQSEVLTFDGEGETLIPSRGLDGVRPTCLAADPHTAGRAWCGTARGGVFFSEDGGASWHPRGLPDRNVTALSASPVEANLVWAGTEPSELWRSEEAGSAWQRMRALEELPSSSDWSFPPRPETHHVRWIAGHPHEPHRLWVAIEAGALVFTADGGGSWRDRVPGGPWDTHELAIHPAMPETLRVAAGDGYFESPDGGITWMKPRAGLDVGYLRSVAIDPGQPEVVLISAASHPYAAYGAGSSDGRIFRRVNEGSWERVLDGWPDPPATIAPLLLAGTAAGELWAADERGLHRSRDCGTSWRQVAGFPKTPRYLHGLALLRS